MWIIAIIAMLCWSGSDIFSKIGSRQSDELSHYKVGIAVGLIMGLHALYELTIGGVDLRLNDIIAYLPASGFYIISMLVGYMGLRYIELSVSSPICNGSGAVAAIMTMLYFGVSFDPNYEGNAVYLNPAIITGIILIVVGIISLGFVDRFEDEAKRLQRQENSDRKYRKSILAVLLPIIYCILDSCGTFVDTLIADSYLSMPRYDAMGAENAELIVGDILNTAYELTWFAVAVVFAIYIFIVKRERISPKYDGAKLLGGISETIGQVFYMMVVVSGFAPGLVIISAYCALSLVWGRIFLKEKLSAKHYISIALAFIGIIILGIYDV